MYSTLTEISQKVGSPFYIVHPELFRENLKNFSKAFTDIYPRFILSYSFKTNYTPFLLQIVKEEGFFAEVVSDIEYDLAKLVGFSGEHIVLNGPVKEQPLLEKAIDNKSIINLDSCYEVETLLKLNRQQKDIRVGLRVNMVLNTCDGSSAIQGGLAESRFGFTESDLDVVIPMLKNAGITINSLHGHVSTMNHSAENYKIIAERLAYIGEKYKLNDVEYIDLGGSFFGAAPKEVDVSRRPSYSDYARVICDALLDNEWFAKHRPFIVIEPGASVVTNVFELVTKIFQHKKVNDKHFVSVDACIYQVRGGKANYPFVQFSDKDPQEEIVADVVGSTCMEVDKVAEQVKLTHYRTGDILIFKASGAYRTNLTPFFINPRCAIVELTSDGCKVVRKRQDANHLLNMLQ